MKLRLKGNTIRLRLGPREVEHLVGEGAIAEQTRFGPGSAALAYTLEMSADAETILATFDGGLRVMVPTADAHRWAASPHEVSLAGSQDVGGGERLSVLIEKDFECLHGEETDDAFPNPNGASGT